METILAFDLGTTALKCALPGQDLRVAEEIHKATSDNDRTMSFVRKSGVALYGAIAQAFL